MKISESILYAGVNDHQIDLFEGQFEVPLGMAYNSYVILDEKTAVMDTADVNFTEEWLGNVKAALGDRKPDYLVVHHMEPDHSASILRFLEEYPETTVVGNAKTFTFFSQFYGALPEMKQLTVKNGDTLELGSHTLNFVLAPMVHWPEVMMSYDDVSGILFSADAFGSFGALNGNLFADEVDFEHEWLPDARRYYCNIVGKYGSQVQDVLKKAGTVDIRMLCPTHGPVWRENLGWILEKYSFWSSYTPEENAVMVVYGSIYGGTESAANALAARISRDGVGNVAVYDVSKTHVSELIGEAFRCSHIVLASITYNNGIFTPMKNFLLDLEAHNLKNRTFALIENGSWSPVAARLMAEILDRLEGTRYAADPVTFLSSPDNVTAIDLVGLADAVGASLGGTVLQETEAEQASSSVKWRCTVCGYEYEGEELPADYVCPICGVGPDKFEKVE